MNRSLDWLHQAQVDLAQAQLSADGAPTDHFGRLQSADAFSHALALVDAIATELAQPLAGAPRCNGLACLAATAVARPGWVAIWISCSWMLPPMAPNISACCDGP